MNPFSTWRKRYQWRRLRREHLTENIQDSLALNSKLKGFCNLENSQIAFQTGESHPSYRRQYRIAHALMDTVDEQEKHWITDGIIVRSRKNSPWNSSILVAPKKDISGKTMGWRVCIDPRHINLLIPEANFPLPLISEVLEALGGAVVYSKTDLKQSFHQLLEKEGDQIKTTFTWRNKQYHFVGAPFGFKNIPSSFQMVMTALFEDLEVYIDDIIIYSSKTT
jgi:hypothetical protein